MRQLLLDRRRVDEVDPRFAANIERHVYRALRADPFHVSANTDPKGDRSKRPSEQDPDFLLHLVRETDNGIVVRGAKYETAACYADQAFVKPTIANWGDDALSDYALGFICEMGAPGLRHICRTGFAGRAPREDYPLANRFDEVDVLLVFDDVEIPWENVLFYRHTRAASYIRATLHRYSAFPFVQRLLTYADLLIGTALFNVRQTGLERQQAVQEKLATLACYREGIDAHLTASIANGQRSPAGLLMPDPSLLMCGRVWACSQLPAMMHLARELVGGQVCVTPDLAQFEAPEPGAWLRKFYSINDEWQAEDRRRLLAFARDLLNSDYAGHRLTFALFAQSPPFAHLAAVYRTFDFPSPDASSPGRDVTTVAPQALFFMNNPFVRENAKGLLARKEVAAEKETAAKVARLYRLLYGRAPGKRETALAREFLGTTPAAGVWEEYAQALLLANEFVFVD